MAAVHGGFVDQGLRRDDAWAFDMGVPEWEKRTITFSDDEMDAEDLSMGLDHTLDFSAHLPSLSNQASSSTMDVDAAIVHTRAATIAPTQLMPALTNVHVDLDISKKEAAGATIPVYEGNVLSAIQAAVSGSRREAKKNHSTPAVTGAAPVATIHVAASGSGTGGKQVEKVKKRPGRKLMDTPTVEDIAKVTDPKERKRLANRKASRECRRRKETQMGALEEEVQDLRKAKVELAGTVHKLQQENCRLSFVKEENERLREQLAMFERQFGALKLQTAVC